MSRTLALVESPAQLLNLLEWALGERRGAVDLGRLDAAVLLPLDGTTRRQLDAMVSVARAEGVGVSVHDIRRNPAALARCVAALAPKLAGAGRLVIGDPFSGLIQRLLPLTRAQDVVLVDDGTATLELSTQLLAGQPLVRWHRDGKSAPASSVRAGRRLTPGHGKRLEVFSSLATDLRLPPGGIVSVNGYSWTRRRYGPPRILPGVDLVGTSLAETGLVSVNRYIAEVTTLAHEYGVDRYLAHRREDPSKLARIAEVAGVEIISPELPLELALRSGPVARTVVSFPSTVVHTLPTVLEGTGVQIVVHDSIQSWLVPGTSDRAAAFLEEVISTARTRHHLNAVRH